MARSDLWSRDQLLMALRLYMRIPFGKLHRGNPQIIDLAARIGRTASALAMKASNFASLDPSLAARGIRGLPNLSVADRGIWDEFSENSESLAVEAEEAADRLTGESTDGNRDIGEPPAGPTETIRSVRTRRVQSFFRAAVATTYGGKCALSGISDPNLLVASHIITWSQSVARRADPKNGILLNALFDRAFDRGLFTFTDEFRVKVSRKLTESAGEAILPCDLH